MKQSDVAQPMPFEPRRFDTPSERHTTHSTHTSMLRLTVESSLYYRNKRTRIAHVSFLEPSGRWPNPITLNQETVSSLTRVTHKDFIRLTGQKR